MSAFARSVVLLFVLPSVGCTRCSDQGQAAGGRPDAAPSASVNPELPVPGSAGAAGAAGDTATAGAAASAGTPGVLARPIPAGAIANGPWIAAYGIEQVPSDTNLTWSEAVAHCREKGKALCSESQWQRACDLDASVSSFESWTMTVGSDGISVRGGGEGCNARKVHQLEEKSAARIGLCCDRAIGLTGDNPSDELRVAATERLLAFEAASSAPTAETLGKLFANEVTLDGAALNREAALAKIAEGRKEDPDGLTLYDRCSVKLTDDTPVLLVADCDVTQRRLGKLRGFSQRVVFVGPTGPVAYVGDPKAMPRKEQKERVKSFLPSE